MTAREHGGSDVRWDFSSCANAAGPCPMALAALRAADPARHADPDSCSVREALAALHGVAPTRVLIACSASEFIQRFTAISGRLWPGAVRVPRHAYGDYAAAALAWGREPVHDDEEAAVTLRWFADPSSPLGQDEAPPPHPGACPGVLDAVYAPLRLSGHTAWTQEASDAVFVLHSPNKALGLPGLRGAYAIAPRTTNDDLTACLHALAAAAPSWPLSAQADAVLRCWARPDTQAWLRQSRATLAAWKTELQTQLAARGFVCRASVTPHFVVQPPRPLSPAALRAHGVAVRDAASFGLSGCWRVSAQPPEAQRALLRAVDA